MTSMSCDDGQPGNMLLDQLSGVLFNILAKNEAKNMNSANYKMKKRCRINRRGGSEARKIQKLHVVLKNISYAPITQNLSTYLVSLKKF